MKVVLIDNGSLEPASHLGLREAARLVSARAGIPVEAVSWKHSDRIDAASLGGVAARVLAPWIRAQAASGEREFLFVPFFASPQGAIGSALRSDLSRLQEETAGFEFSFTAGLSEGSTLSRILADRVKKAIAAYSLRTPSVIVADHGGPSPDSLALRDRVAGEVRDELGGAIGALAAASMESRGGNALPLLGDVLASRSFSEGDVVIAPLFLLPGRHAGPDGDLAGIARSAESASPGLRCHFAGLLGDHPLAIEALSTALAAALSPTVPA
jgi:sirohydrochlorin ferrochelatase